MTFKTGKKRKPKWVPFPATFVVMKRTNGKWWAGTVSGDDGGMINRWVADPKKAMPVANGSWEHKVFAASHDFFTLVQVYGSSDGWDGEMIKSQAQPPRGWFTFDLVLVVVILASAWGWFSYDELSIYGKPTPLPVLGTLAIIVLIVKKIREWKNRQKQN